MRAGNLGIQRQFLDVPGTIQVNDAGYRTASNPIIAGPGRALDELPGSGLSIDEKWIWLLQMTFLVEQLS
jgi:hypothetical protein